MRTADFTFAARTPKQLECHCGAVEKEAEEMTRNLGVFFTA